VFFFFKLCKFHLFQTATYVHEMGGSPKSNKFGTYKYAKNPTSFEHKINASQRK